MLLPCRHAIIGRRPNSIACINSKSARESLCRRILAPLSDSRTVLVEDVRYWGNNTANACQDGKSVMNAHVLVERDL